jgi:hypothetical protein
MGLPKITGNLGAAGGIGAAPGLSRKPAADPLAGVEYSGDLAADAAAELSAMEQAYRDRNRAEADRFRHATDSEFWFAVCFADRAEKDAFLAEFGVTRLGDKYIDGRLLAQALRKMRGSDRPIPDMGGD